MYTHTHTGMCSHITAQTPHQTDLPLTDSMTSASNSSFLGLQLQKKKKNMSAETEVSTRPFHSLPLILSDSYNLGCVFAKNGTPPLCHTLCPFESIQYTPCKSLDEAPTDN